MPLFDFGILILALLLMNAAKHEHRLHATIIYCQLAALLFVDVLYIDIQLYKFVSTSWFFIIKGFILTAAISMMYITNGHKWVAVVLFLNMVYLYGVWFERSFTTISQPFHTYFIHSMVIIMLLEILYLFGVSNGYDKLKCIMDNIRRYWIDNLFSRVVHDFTIQNGEAKR